MTPEEVGQQLSIMEEQFQKLITLIERDGSWISGTMAEVEAAEKKFERAISDLRYDGYVEPSRERNDYY